MRGIGKLRSRSGATMVLALLVFMLCIFVGTAALTAAAANSGRYTHLKEEEQAYLNVSSAAKLFRDEFLGNVFSAEVEIKEVTDAAGGAVGTPVITVTGDIDPVAPATVAGKIPQEFKEYLVSLINSKEDSTTTVIAPPTGFTVTYGGNDVNVTVNSPSATDQGVNFKFTFSVGSDANYKTVLTLVGTLSYSTPEVKTETASATGNVITTTTRTATVAWTSENAHISEAKD